MEVGIEFEWKMLCSALALDYNNKENLIRDNCRSKTEANVQKPNEMELACF